MFKNLKKYLVVILLLVLSIPSFFILLKRGFYEPHDLHHIADIYEMFRAFQSGQIPPRLGPDFSFGYGYPLFNFYYVLPFYLGAMFFTLVGSLTLSFKLVMILTIIISVYGMYLFLREFLDRFPAIVGSLLFLYTPYRAVEIYVRGAIGEALSISLLPLVGWAFIKVVKKPTARIIALASIITSLFFLSHNYLSFLSIPIIFIFIVPFILNIKKRKTTTFSLIKVLLISLGISAYWWLPALIEQKNIIATTPFPLKDHFPFIKQLIIPYWGYGASLWGPSDGLSFQIGLVNIAAILTLIILVLFFKKYFKEIIFQISLLVLGGFILSFVFMNIRTLPLWKLIPFHDFIQFPWRLLFYTTFFTAVAASLSIQIVSKKVKYILGFIIIIASFALTINYFRPENIVYKNDNEYLARFFANRSISGKTEGVSKTYLGYSEDYLLLPKWVDKRPEILPLFKIETSDNSEVINLQEVNSLDWKAKIISNSENIVTFHSYYFPGWYARINNKNTEIKIGKPYGDIQIEVPKGENEVEFYFRETIFRRTINIISLTILIATIYVIFMNKTNNTRHEK